MHQKLKIIILLVGIIVTGSIQHVVMPIMVHNVFTLAIFYHNNNYDTWMFELWYSNFDRHERKIHNAKTI